MLQTIADVDRSPRFIKIQRVKRQLLYHNPLHQLITRQIHNPEITRCTEAIFLLSANQLNELQLNDSSSKEISMDAITTKQAEQDLDGLIERVIADVQPTILCNDKGDRVVVMPLDEFNSWQETLYLLSNPANAAHLMGSIQEAKAGNVTERELIEE
jgi:antitoxin YefM